MSDDQVHRIWIRVLETQFVLECASEASKKQLANEWARCLVTELPDASAEVVALHRDGRDLEGGLGYELTTRLTTGAIQALAGERLMLHAAAVARPSGQTLALVAGSGTGKTTAAIALAQRGWGYVTDETVAVDGAGRVTPFPKPLAMVAASGRGQTKVQCGPDELGLGVAPSELRLTRMVVLSRTAAPEVGLVLERLSMADALMAVIPQTSALPRMVAPLDELCAAVARCGGVFRLTYSDIRDAIPVLEKLQASTSSDPVEWHRDAGEQSADDLTWALRDGRIRRRPVTDAVRLPAETVVMAGPVPVRLSGIGPTVWEACQHPTSIDELVTRVVQAHGEHADALQLVSDTVQGMRDADVLGWARPMTIADMLAGRLSTIAS